MNSIAITTLKMEATAKSDLCHVVERALLVKVLIT
jgi:hypothetical protein